MKISDGHNTVNKLYRRNSTLTFVTFHLIHPDLTLRMRMSEAVKIRLVTSLVMETQAVIGGVLLRLQEKYCDTVANIYRTKFVSDLLCAAARKRTRMMGNIWQMVVLHITMVD